VSLAMELAAAIVVLSPAIIRRRATA